MAAPDRKSNVGQVFAATDRMLRAEDDAVEVSNSATPPSMGSLCRSGQLLQGDVLTVA